MGKYTVVGAANILLGISLTGLSLVQVFIVIPRLKNLYTNMAAAGPSPGGIYPLLGTVFAVGAIDLFFGFKLLTGDGEAREKFFKYGVASAMLPLILSALTLVVWVRDLPH